jgi:hypothetical protein
LVLLPLSHAPCVRSVRGVLLDANALCVTWFGSAAREDLRRPPGERAAPRGPRGVPGHCRGPSVRAARGDQAAAFCSAPAVFGPTLLATREQCALQATSFPRQAERLTSNGVGSAECEECQPTSSLSIRLPIQQSSRSTGPRSAPLRSTADAI